MAETKTELLWFFMVFCLEISLFPASVFKGSRVTHSKSGDTFGPVSDFLSRSSPAFFSIIGGHTLENPSLDYLQSPFLVLGFSQFFEFLFFLKIFIFSPRATFQVLELLEVTNFNTSKRGSSPP